MCMHGACGSGGACTLGFRPLPRRAHLRPHTPAEQKNLPGLTRLKRNGVSFTRAYTKCAPLPIIRAVDAAAMGAGGGH